MKLDDVKVGAEYCYLGQFVKVRAVRSVPQTVNGKPTEPYGEAEIETRFGERDTIPVASLSQK
jgi:hypothetical protein